MFRIWRTRRSFSLGKTDIDIWCRHYSLSICRRRFGNQGAAQAQNLRDSGIPNEKILVANRDDSYAKDAKAKNFTVTPDFSKAAEIADGMFLVGLIWISTCLRPVVLFLLIPDQVQPRLFNEKISPSLKPGCTIVVASGYNVFFKLLNIPLASNVVMVAPR